jgi:hypothetical protein
MLSKMLVQNLTQTLLNPFRNMLVIVEMVWYYYDHGIATEQHYQDKNWMSLRRNSIYLGCAAGAESNCQMDRSPAVYSLRREREPTLEFHEMSR